MKQENKIKSLYEKSYFENRTLNDLRRLISFRHEKEFIKNVSKLQGTCLDVGCGTGEFLTAIEWHGKKYGIEISDHAAAQASEQGVEIVDRIDEPQSLDAIFYRGTIQHLDSPFRSIQKAVQTLHSEGTIFFIATPNIDSIYYRLFRDLPALDKRRNFFLPSAQNLKNIMGIYDFVCVSEEFPYANSPYSNIITDHFRFAKKACISAVRRDHGKIEFPFWGSMLNMAFKRKMG